jgi:hypothetical protein
MVGGPEGHRLLEARELPKRKPTRDGLKQGAENACTKARVLAVRRMWYAQARL